MRIIFKLLILSSIGISSLVNAQTWRSALYPVNWTPQGNFYTDKIVQDFSYAGYQRGEKNIPTITTNIKNVTLAPYLADKTGATDVTAKIQQAINDVSASGGGVVYLPAGTYKINPGANNFCLKISKSNVVLRGEGKDKTFILNSSYKMNNKSIIKVEGVSGWYGTENNKTLITQNLTGPVKDIPVQNASAYAVGDLVVLRNYINDAWINEHKVTQWLGYGANLKGLAFCRQVMKVDLAKNIITVDAPIRYSMLTRDGSAVYKVNGMISEVGVESLAIGNVQNPSTSGFGEEDYTVVGKAAYDCHASYALYFSGATNSWINNVVSFKYASNTSTAHILSNGVLLNQCKNVTVQNCYFQRPQFGGGGGNGYMYRVSGSENLVANSTAEFMRHGFVFSSMCASGNVIYKCSDIKTASATGNTGYYRTSGSGSDHHMHFSTSNLIDQCTTNNSFFAAGYRNYGGTPKHGITGAHTVYWNMTGMGADYNYTVHTQQARYGYAIGTSGTSSGVKTGELSLAGSAAITAPVDHVEGQGTGATLEPQSLYKDQLAKRLNTTNPCTGNTAPVISLTSSIATAVAPATFSLNAIASDAGGSISKVEFYEGTTLLGSTVTAPYSLALTSSVVGTHSYTAKATDNCGATKLSTAVNVVVTAAPVGNILPTVTLSSPSNNIAYTSPATISIAASANDADGTITKVEFYQGATLLNSDVTTPYAYSWAGVAAGTYVITAKAYDNAGGSKTSTAATVKVNAPTNTTVGISGPAIVAKGSSNVYTIVTEANATSASWWANADATITVDLTNFKRATIKLNSAQSSYVISCGVNYSSSPYYKEYKKTIIIGNTTGRIATAQVSPFPAEEISTVKVEGEKIKEISILNIQGQVLSTYHYSGLEEVQLQSDLPPALYILQIISDEGTIRQQFIKAK